MTLPITIGSDPEFGLMSQDGKQVLAFRYLSGGTEIGTDGHSHIGELRPRYGETPREHLLNIAELIERTGKKIPDHIKITAGSMVSDDPIGGHIHFGRVGGTRFDKFRAARALDFYLALPVALLEVQSSAKDRRTKSSYGRLSAMRNTRYGFEYRTLPSWLTGWGVALSILSAGYAIVDAVKKKDCPPVPDHLPNDIDFRNCNKEAIRPLLSQIKAGWRQLPLYAQFRLEFAFLNHLFVRGLEWKEDEDIRYKWKPQANRNKLGIVLGNARDKNCIQIAQRVKGVKGTKVLIYGLKPDRELDIAVSDLDIMSGIKLDYPVQGGSFGIAGDPHYNGWLRIGLSLELRQNVPAAVNLVNSILGGTTDDLPTVPSESSGRNRPPPYETLGNSRWTSATSTSGNISIGTATTNRELPF